MTSSFPSIVIVSAARTPIGGFQGALSKLSATELGATAIQSVLERSGFDAQQLSEVMMGCVLPAGLNQAPARQAALGAGIPDSVPATTLNKVCGSGMKTVMLGVSQLQTGEADVVIAGGMESMSNAPYLIEKARQGLRLGHGKVLDHMFVDGLEDAYDGKLMGFYAQQAADRFAYTREQLDDYALLSLQRAQHAIANDYFKNEIVPVAVGDDQVIHDEQPGKAKPEKVRTLKPVFSKNGTITAANSSSISDGAAALLLMREGDALAQGFKPLARISGYCSHAQKPAEFTLAPVGCVQKLLNRLGWQADEVDLYEINEAFAVVALLALNELGIDQNKMNIHGGACALGHPLGASGARIIVTLLHALQRTGGKKGIASLCIGGGEATAIAIERT